MNLTAAALLARAAQERAEAERACVCADPIREAIHRYCAAVLEELARASALPPG